MLLEDEGVPCTPDKVCCLSSTLPWWGEGPRHLSPSARSHTHTGFDVGLGRITIKSLTHDSCVIPILEA
ncbi:hypothetical protein PIB30_032277 [Stylosanthes scabra]|uniref:Uncharacterized protein n=1 Tax=Stylosanthes scabra TaxID=79078 RepID=A0ABU6XB21_9FABA|nr:hypothetical protein [Stylosanthes scabra]